MAFNVSHLPSPIASRLRQFYVRKQALALGRVLFAVVIFYAIALFITTHIDRFVFLSTGARLAMLVVVHVLGAAMAAAGVFLWWWRRPSPRAIAYELEQALAGAAGEQIVTLESVLRDHPAAAARLGVAGGGEVATQPRDLPEAVGQRLVEQLKSATVRFSEGREVVALVRDAWFNRLGIIAAALLALGILLAVPASYQWPLMLARFYQPTNQNLARPSFLKLDATPAGTTLGRGSELVIQAKLDDQTPLLLTPLMDLLGASADRVRLQMTGPEVADLPADERNIHMSRVQRDLYLHTRSDLQDDLTFRLRAGNAQAGPHKVDVMVQPSITDLQLGVIPPDYTWPSEQEPAPDPVDQPQEPVRVLQDSAVVLSFSADQPVTEARLEPVEGGEIIELDWDEQTNSAHRRFEPRKPMSYRLIVVSEHGFENVDRPTISITVSEDLPPTITLRYPPSEFTAVGPQIVPLEANIEDNLGVESVDITYVLNPSPVEEQVPKRLPVEIEEREGQAKIELNSQIDLAETGAVPGDTVLVQIRAADAAGGESTSRAVLVRVVPFSRGEHERQRLATLGAVNDVLGMLLTGNADAEPSGLAVDRAFSDELWTRITDAVEGAGAPIPNPDAPTIAALFRLLELEHDLTERAVDRRDMRRMIGVLRVAAEPALRDEGLMDDQLRTLTGQVVPKLRSYRLSRNLSARLFGLRNEANRLKGELQTRPDGAQPNLAAINRRAKLYLDALQATGEDLLGLARASDLLDAEALEPRVAEMNTDAFFLTSGGLASRRRAVDGLQGKLTRVITTVQDAIPTLYEDALVGRRTLRSLYNDAKQTALDAIDRQPEAATLEAAKRWLSSEQGMLDHDPFSPIAARMARITMLDALSGRTDQPTQQPSWQAGEATMRQREPAPDAAVLEALARQERLARLLEADLPPAELSFSVALLKMEAAGGERDADGVDTAAERLRAVSVTPATDDAPSPTFALSDMPLPPNARSLLREAGQAAADRFGDVDTTALLDRLMETITVTQGALEELANVAQAEDGDLVAATKAAQEALDREVSISNSSLALLAAAPSVVPGAGADVARIDAVRQQWSESFARYMNRTAAGRSAIKPVAEGGASAEAVSELKANVSRLAMLHEASFGVPMRKLKDSWAEVEDARPLQTNDPLLAQTRQLAGLALVQSTDERSATRALEALQQFEAAPGMWLNSWADEAQRAAEAIDSLRTALAAESVTTERARRLAERAAEELGRIVEALSAGERNARIARALSQVQPAQRLAAKLTEMPLDTDATISRARYAAADLAGDLEVLADDLARAAGRTERGDYFRLPIASWMKLFENDIRHREQQLNAFTDQAKRQALLGVVTALSEAPDASAIERGYAWIVAAYRLARTDLYQPGGRSTVDDGTGPETGDQFLEFLLNELQEARQQPEVPYWNERIAPYLDGVEDAIQFFVD